MNGGPAECSAQAGVSRKLRRRPLKICFLPLETSRSAATRSHCDIPARLLSERGVAAVVLKPAAALELVVVASRPRLVKAAYAAFVVLPKTLMNVALASRADVVVIQRAIFRYDVPPLLERILRRCQQRHGRVMVLNLDDALYEVRPEYFAERIKLADVVSTGNAAIAQRALELGARVFEYPATLEVSRYRLKTVDPKRRRIVIGWTGTQPWQDLRPFEHVVREVCRLRPNLVFRIVSRERWGFDDEFIRQEWQPWRADDQFQYLAEFDVGIMTLADTAYNRAKESYKLKEYMATGLPTVSSRVGHNLQVVEHGVDGYLASTADEWVRYLLRLIDEPDVRRQVGRHARIKAEQTWDVLAIAPYLDELQSMGCFAR